MLFHSSMGHTKENVYHDLTTRMGGRSRSTLKLIRLVIFASRRNSILRGIIFNRKALLDATTCNQL